MIKTNENKRCKICNKPSKNYELCKSCWQLTQMTFCEYCGEESEGYPLCYDCYLESKSKNIIQMPNGIWIKNVIRGYENRYYQEDKDYTKRITLMSTIEKDFYHKLVNTLDKKKYIICPQISLQAIIKTNSNKRNDELFRIIDFLIADIENDEPLFLIEINGKEHYTSDERIARDESVKSIIQDAQIPLFTLTNQEAQEISKQDLKETLQTICDYIKTFQPIYGEVLEITDITLNNINKLKEQIENY